MFCLRSVRAQDPGSLVASLPRLLAAMAILQEVTQVTQVTQVTEDRG